MEQNNNNEYKPDDWMPSQEELNDYEDFHRLWLREFMEGARVKSREFMEVVCEK